MLKEKLFHNSNTQSNSKKKMKRKKGNAAAVRPEHEYNSRTKLWTQIYRQEAPTPNKQ